MNTSTVNTATRQSTQAPDQSLAKVLGQALSVFNDAILIVNLQTQTISWSSAAARRLLPELETDGLTAVLARADLDLPSLVQHLNERPSSQAGGNLNLILRAVEGSPRLDSSICIIDQQWLVLRCSDSRDDFLQLQNYMEEREKLFTTSRTISVSEMATTLAHELNQPIGTIANILKGIQSRLPANIDERAGISLAVEKAIDQSQFAARIIARIRDFTQSRQPRRVDCDILVLLKQCVELLDWVVAKAEVSVKFKAPSDVIMVNGDPTMLQQVFTNLIRNAVEAMRDCEPQHRRLSLTLSLREGDAQIAIADSGHGLSNTAESNLFVPFVTQKSHGMGVGLNICRSFVELHQGRLWLAQNDSGGCTSFVVLPLSPQQANAGSL